MVAMKVLDLYGLELLSGCIEFGPCNVAIEKFQKGLG